MTGSLRVRRLWRVAHSSVGMFTRHRHDPPDKLNCPHAMRRVAPPPCSRTTGRTGLPRNSPSLAVALNCGMGSTSLNAEVNAFERLQIVRDRWVTRKELRGRIQGEVKRVSLSAEGKLALVGLAIATAPLVASSALDFRWVHRLAAEPPSRWPSWHGEIGAFC